MTQLIPAATILMVRDGATGLEVFMVKRHHQIDFAAGALVFPGGKLAKGDADPALAPRLLGAEDVSAHERAFRIAAIREGFEEAGLFLAHARGASELLGPERLTQLEPFRAPLARGEIGIGALLAQEDLVLDLGSLIPFAHWIAPEFAPKRFDTLFFLCAAPERQVGLHDGSESVDSIWIRPQDALKAAAEKRMTIIFPTRMNLMKLGRAATVADALAAARAATVATVCPWIEERDGRKYVVIQPEAGYDAVVEPLESVFS